MHVSRETFWRLRARIDVWFDSARVIGRECNTVVDRRGDAAARWGLLLFFHFHEHLDLDRDAQGK